MDKFDSANVVICIPIYKPELSIFEQAALRQLNKVLANYQRVFFAPESLAFDFGELGEGIKIERFPDCFFRGMINYSALLLNVDFYRRFQQYEYMLIYQTDAFVFSDRLADFCAMGYDYIGAPVSRINPLWNFITARVGNGGLSLRKVSSAIRMLEKCKEELDGPLAGMFWQWEDIFWGYCGRHKHLNFKVPSVRLATEFALQDDVAHGFKRMQKGWRPFGCHGWWQMDYYLWRPIIEACGYNFSGGEKYEKKRFPRLDNYLKSRNTVNFHYLWGLYKNGLYKKMMMVLKSWLALYPPDDSAWQLNMENIICLWRLIEMEHANNKYFRIPCQKLLISALQNAIKMGVKDALCRSLIVSMLPYLQKYDYKEMQDLAKQIRENIWKIWSDTGRKDVVSRRDKKNKIIVISKAFDDDWLVESFVRHTLTFATALVLDISNASRKVEKILDDLEQEGLPIVLHKQSLQWQDVADDMDLVLEFSMNDFILPQVSSDSVNEYLCKLKKGCSYLVEMGRYMPYLPFAYNEKFILTRPLMRYIEGKDFAYLLNVDGKQANKIEGLYIARMEGKNNLLLNRGIMPADMELVDISYFAMNHRLIYTHGE